MTDSDLPSSLRYASDNMAGYHRESDGDAFVYSDENRVDVKDKKTLKRINELVIPPMWQNVWICKDPKGYIQVVGRDAKGRKQYIYHQLLHWPLKRRNFVYKTRDEICKPHLLLWLHRK